jgi:hypothetical protein
MAAEVIQIDAQSFISQTYEIQQTSLISTYDVDTTLNSSSYLELFIYDNNQSILTSDYNFNQYTVLNNGQSAGSNNVVSQIEIDPEKILVDNSFDQGVYITYLNVLNKKIGSYLEQLYISEISSDRTEIRLDSTVLSNIDLTEQTNNFIQERENSPYFVDFYLNFGENILAIANNIQLDNTDPNDVSILVKLYEPLPSTYDLNSQLWIVTFVEESIAYSVTFEDLPIIITDTVTIKGPNYNLDLKDQINNSTVALNYDSLTSTTLTSSYNQLSSLLEEKEIDINIDYTSFPNFTHFSSVKTRLENFYYKVSLLENYSASLSTIDTQITGSTSSSLAITNNKAIYEGFINDIITNFDGYEYYLYYSSGSWAWPKINSQPPYQLYTTGSTQVLNWFGSDDETSIYYGGIILSASVYDNANPDNLYYAIPEYLRNDSANQPYELFVSMVGQFYDNIWVYYKDVTEKYNADNRLENGVSKDIVADAIRDFGIKLYQNNFSMQDLYTAFIGLTPEGSLFPFPNITGSLPTPSGFEYVDTLISASNDYMPLDDVNKSLYKRIYHNLPYLLKSKGTLPGLRTLITSYGIPDTVLRIKEYGGKDKVNVNDWDYWQNTFNYAFYTTGSNSISSNWKLNPNWNSPNSVPATLAFRFKTEGLPTSSIPYSQSLWYTDTFSSIVLQYTGSGYTTGSYSGSIINPYYQYANLVFYPDPTIYPGSSASIYLPFFDGGWWSVMVTRNGDDFNLYAGNKIYEGGDNGTLLGFYSSSSINEDSTFWILGSNTTFTSQNPSIPGGIYEAFSGSLQEIRYYNSVISESVFKDYIMNPHSIEGNFLNSSPDNLAFRASLGGELYTGSVSIHPKVTGFWATTSSFNFNSDFVYGNTPTFNPNTEYFFIDQPLAGIKNAISDKIRIEDNILPSGDTLSAFKSLSQNLEISQSYTANTNLLEVAFSPQDEINDDIANQIGYYNIGEYIGDPRFRSSSALSYPELDTLRNAYFEKYIKNYDLNDYIRLIKFFDNSLFKMVKDFVPARTSLASGIVIKQHLLERNRYPEPQVDNYSTIAYTTSGSQNNVPFTFQDISVTGTLAPQWNGYQPGTVENFSGGPAGVFNPYNGVSTSPYGANGTGPNNIYFMTQSWYENIPTISGSVLVLHSTQDEFYNGEFSGSVLTVTTQSLANPYPLQNESFSYKQVYYYGTGSNEESIFENLFLNNVTSPQNGEILFMEKGNILFGSWSSLYSPKYLKIAKIDCSGSNNTIALGQLDTILINTPVSGLNTWLQYDVTVLNEQSNYYLYQVATVKYLNQPATYIPSFYPNQVLNYTVSASKTTSQVITTPLIGTYPIITNYQTEIGDILNYFNLTTGLYTLGNTPNTPLLITASITNAGDASVGSGNAFIEVLRNGNRTQISSINSFTTTSPTTVTISASYYGLAGDQVYVRATKNGAAPTTDYTVTNVQLLLTQSRAVSSSNCELVIFEPYVTEPNYYYSNYNPVMNNVIENRLSTRYEEVSYNPGIQTPSNFAQIISGSAIKADVQDSNYSSKRVINPRYDGVKSTSQQLNVWTSGDTGTYGKTPTAQNLKTMVAYCDLISGWPPERMNASAIHIKYLIKSDGTVVIPNVSENSLYDNQGTFLTGENIIINTATIGTSNIPSYRKVIKGASSLFPLMTNQIGREDNTNTALWSGSIRFTDPNDPSTTAIFITGSTPATSLFQSGSGAGLENSIWLDLSVSNRTLVFLPSSSLIQDAIPNSGFNPFAVPGLPQTGDELRFMGLEKYAYMVVSSSLDLTPFSEKLIFYVDKPVQLFINASPSSSFNLNKFLWRRYVDEASQIIMEGYRPFNSQGPYIVRPEYVVPELNKSVDEFILDLTQKGLIP